MRLTNILLTMILLLLLYTNFKPFIFPEANADGVQAVKIVSVGNSGVYGGYLPVKIVE